MAQKQGESLQVTHLQYADDTLIFCDANQSQLRYLRIILILFEATSGVHINWRKSQIYPVRAIDNIQELVDILGETGRTPTMYLGMPLGKKQIHKHTGGNH